MKDLTSKERDIMLASFLFFYLRFIRRQKLVPGWEVTELDYVGHLPEFLQLVSINMQVIRQGNADVSGNPVKTIAKIITDLPGNVLEVLTVNELENLFMGLHEYFANQDEVSLTEGSSVWDFSSPEDFAFQWSYACLRELPDLVALGLSQGRIYIPWFSPTETEGDVCHGLIEAVVADFVKKVGYAQIDSNGVDRLLDGSN